MSMVTMSYSAEPEITGQAFATISVASLDQWPFSDGIACDDVIRCTVDVDKLAQFFRACAELGLNPAQAIFDALDVTLDETIALATPAERSAQ